MEEQEEGQMATLPNDLFVEFKNEDGCEEDQEDGLIGSCEDLNDPLAECSNDWKLGSNETNATFEIVVKAEALIKIEPASQEENQENLPLPPPPPIFQPTASNLEGGAKKKDPPAKKGFQSKNVKVLEDKEKVLIPEIRSVPCTESSCFICGSPSGRKKVPSSAIDDLYITNRILVPENARRCADYHIENECFTPYTKALIEMKATVPAKLAPKQFAQILNRFADKLDPTPKKRRRAGKKPESTN